MNRIRRGKELIDNILIYGLFGSLEKVVPLIMLPIITRIITDTTEYGAYSMFTTIQSFGIQIAILGLYDAVFREYYEREDSVYRRKVLSSALDIVIFSSFGLSVLLVLFSSYFSNVFFGRRGYNNFVYMAAIGLFAGATRSILSLPTRIKNERKVYIFSSFFQAIIGYVFAMIMIYAFRMNYESLVYSSVITSILLTIYFIHRNGREFCLLCFNKKVSKELLKIGLPLLPTFIIYWVFNSCDKLMITNMLGLRDVGIFTIGVKVASISQIIYTAFATGWQYFAFKTMKDKDQVEMTSRIMEYLLAITAFVFMFATIFDEPIFRLVFDGDYELGYKVFPYLFLSPLLLMLYQTGANQFLVFKKSYLSTICLASGAVLNVALNYIMILMRGIEGAALATLVGYLTSIVMMLIFTIKHGWCIISRNFLILLGIIIVMSITVLFNSDIISIILAIAFATLIGVMYRRVPKQVIGLIRNSNTNSIHEGR